MALLAVPMAASAFSGPPVGQPSRSALRMQLVPVESSEKVKMNEFGIMKRYLGNTDLLVSECCLVSPHPNPSAAWRTLVLPGQRLRVLPGHP